MKKLAILIGMLVLLSFGANAWAEFTLVLTDLTSPSGYNGGTGNPPDVIVTNQYATSANDGITFSDPTLGNLGSRTVASNNVTVGSQKFTLGGATFGYATSAFNYWADDGATTTDSIGTGTGNQPSNNYKTIPTSNFIGFNKGTNASGAYNAGAEITFSSALTSLSFGYYRPGNNTTAIAPISVYLFNNGIPVGTLVTPTAYTASGGFLPFSTLTGATSTDSGTTPPTTFSYSAADPAGLPFNEVVLTSTYRFMIDNIQGQTAGSTTPIPPSIGMLAAGLLGLLGIRRKFFS